MSDIVVIDRMRPRRENQPMTVDGDAGGMEILQKSGAIVSALEELGEATAQTLAARTDEPVSSTYRLLSSLREIGWVDPAPRRGYFRLGVRLVRIGSLLEDQVNVRDACKPALEELRRRTNATAFLCFLRSDTAVCVERLDGRDVHSLAMRLGDSLPLFRGAAPLAILAFVAESEREAILARLSDRRRNGEAIPSDASLREAIASTRSRGYSLSDEDVTPGIGAIGAPVFNHRGELEGAISVSGLRNQILSGQLPVPQLTMQAADDASRALGYRKELIAG
ncbi:IclR family transcriptional regulator [Micromonospora sp. DT81.3]|uniref:IclR family transcriptional regulator n=1 Tax=Micromonospora sp. DT81.3 TaxID=3416523 RepID=UPI003CEA73D8